MDNKIMINLDYHSRLPIYTQIVNIIERYIILGILKPHDQIPSIRDLASTLGINPNTVRKAYLELENKGVILTVSTKGTFINDDVSSLTTNKIKDYYQSIENSINELIKMGVSKEEISNKLDKYLK